MTIDSATSLGNAKCAEVNEFDHHGMTPLHCAAQSGSVDATLALLAEGASTHLLNDHDNSPLHLAAK